MIRRTTRSTRTDPLFPNTTVFRSGAYRRGRQVAADLILADTGDRDARGARELVLAHAEPVAKHANAAAHQAAFQPGDGNVEVFGVVGINRNGDHSFFVPLRCSFAPSSTVSCHLSSPATGIDSRKDRGFQYVKIPVCAYLIKKKKP